MGSSTCIPDGFLGAHAKSRYLTLQEQSRPKIRQPPVTHPDVCLDIINLAAVYSCLHRCQRSKNITTSASKGEESLDRDGPSR